ncbi:hypothetical protein AC578_6374 [Pseudocercospora eumusae]|uniref:Uncharacterized protein n=1 Tax=Pseudocercospora eumusae TaxID=321146 RepID=A0A139H0Z2_9PEZI|nr:hypothetical protein AC578_6374 [Pseudocercospora eumusae]
MKDSLCAKICIFRIIYRSSTSNHGIFITATNKNMSPPHSASRRTPPRTGSRASISLPIRTRTSGSKFQDALMQQITTPAAAGNVVDRTEAVAQLSRVEETAEEAVNFFTNLVVQTRTLRESIAEEEEEDEDEDQEMTDEEPELPEPAAPRKSQSRRYPSRSSRTNALRVQNGRISRPYSGRPRSEIYNYREMLSPVERLPPRASRRKNAHRLSPVFEESEDDGNEITAVFAFTGYPAEPDDRIDPRTGFAVPPPWIKFKYDREGRVVFKGRRDDWEGLEDFLPPHPWAGDGGRFGNVTYADRRPCHSSAREASRAPKARRVQTPRWALDLGHGEL